jgi:hypothetical protein
MPTPMQSPMRSMIVASPWSRTSNRYADAFRDMQSTW